MLIDSPDKKKYVLPKQQRIQMKEENEVVGRREIEKNEQEMMRKEKKTERQRLKRRERKASIKQEANSVEPVQIDQNTLNKLQGSSGSKSTEKSSLGMVSNIEKTESNTAVSFDKDNSSKVFEEESFNDEASYTSSDSESASEDEDETGEDGNANLTSDEIELSSNLEQLSSIFSYIPLKHLQLIIEKSNGDIQEATDICLSYDLLKSEFETQTPSLQWEIMNKKNEDFVKKAEKIQYNTESIESLDITIARMDKADKIYDYLRLGSGDQEKVTYFLKRNKDDIYTAVLDILINWRGNKSLYEQGSHKLHESNIPGGSFSGLSYAESLSVDLTRNIKDKKLDLVRDNVSNEDWKLLASYIKNNTSLKIPSNFYINALVWFNFNVIEVLFLARSLADERLSNGNNRRGVKITQQQMYQFIGAERLNKDSNEVFGDKEVVFKIPKKSVRNGRLYELKSAIESTKLQISNEGNKSVKSHYASKLSQMQKEVKELRISDQDELFTHMKQMADKKSMVDLHSFTVKNAMQLVKRVLSEWWEEELYYRGLDGGNGSKVIYVEPFNVITGKGIHSSGGPVIMNSVKNYLQSEQWIFEDNSGSFLVVGKRT